MFGLDLGCTQKNIESKNAAGVKLAVDILSELILTNRGV